MALSDEDRALIRWVQSEYVNCRKSNCNKCEYMGRGAHGPYWYGYWKAGTKTRKVYIGRELPDDLRWLVSSGPGWRPPTASATPKDIPPRSAARVTRPELSNAAAHLAEAESTLRMSGDYSREKLRKRLWNRLDGKTLTAPERNELVAAAAVLCKAKGWPPFAHVGRRPQKS